MRILVTGASGGLGAYLLERLVRDGHEPIAWGGKQAVKRSGIEVQPVDITDGSRLQSAISDANPDVVIHLAAISSAADAYNNPARAIAVNVDATRHLSTWCHAHDRRLVFTSTDLVFSGKKAWNREDDPTGPLLIYGRTKADAENSVRNVPSGLIVRLPLMFGPSKCGRPGFFDHAVHDLLAGKPRYFFDDEYRTPLDYTTAADILTHLSLREETGIIHVAGAGRISRFELMRRIADAMQLDVSLIMANRRADAPGAEPRPADVSLSTERLMSIAPELSRPTVEEVAKHWRQDV